MKKKKKYWLLIIIPLALLLAYTGYTIWFRENIRHRFTGQLEQYDDNDYMLTTEDHEIYACHLPAIFWGGQNLELVSPREYIIGDESVDSNREVNEYYSLSIPFEFFSSGWDVHIVMGYADENGEIQSVMFDLDEHMNPINEAEMSAVELQKYEELKPRIEELYRKVYDMWGICNIDE